MVLSLERSTVRSALFFYPDLLDNVLLILLELFWFIAVVFVITAIVNFAVKGSVVVTLAIENCNS